MKTLLTTLNSSGINWTARIRHWALLRVFVEALAVILVVVASAILSRTLIPQAQSPLHHNLLILSNLLSAAAALAAYAWSVRVMEQRAATEINLRHGAAQFGIGAFAGAAGTGMVYLVLQLLGDAHFAGGTGSAGLGGSLVAYFAAANFEELLMRAVLFRIVQQATGTTAAIVFSAVLFGLAHGLNANASVMGVIGIALEAGVTLALAFALTGNLWIAIGLHLGWNFCEGSIFGAQVSGSSEAHTILRTALTGPDLLTGGAFGPEASVVAIGFWLTAASGLGYLVVRGGKWRSPRFNLKLA